MSTGKEAQNRMGLISDLIEEVQDELSKIGDAKLITFLQEVCEDSYDIKLDEVDLVNVKSIISLYRSGLAKYIMPMVKVGYSAMEIHQTLNELILQGVIDKLPEGYRAAKLVRH